jgi:hypothetical protein
MFLLHAFQVPPEDGLAGTEAEKIKSLQDYANLTTNNFDIVSP